jgi:hypothetical protein
LRSIEGKKKVKTLRPHDRETRLYFNRELCDFTFSFPIVIEPKEKNMFAQVKHNPIDWVKVCTLPDSAVLDMENSLGKI